MAQQRYPLTNGAANVNNGSASAALIAAAGAGKVIRLAQGVISVVVAATGGGGKISIKDGSTVIMSWDADSITSIPFSFHESTGYPGTANTALNLVAEGAGANQATCFAAVTGYVVG